MIGPNAHDLVMQLGNYNGTPSSGKTVLDGIREKVSAGTVVTYAQGCEIAEGVPPFEAVPSDVLSTSPDGKEQGLRFAPCRRLGRKVQCPLGRLSDTSCERYLPPWNQRLY